MKKLFLLVALMCSSFAFSFNAEQEFNSKCLMCHTLGAKAVGPDLLAAIPAARKALGKKADAYFMAFINDSKKTLASDAYAKKTYPNAMRAMPSQNFTAVQSKAIVKYIESKKK